MEQTSLAISPQQYRIEPANREDVAGVLYLYKKVAAIEGGLARSADEISVQYVEHFVARSLSSGVMLVARSLTDQSIVGEIHAYELGPRVFAHVLGELTIAVHPDWQGAGLGRGLFERLMQVVAEDRPDISRVELIARESNRRAIEFYEKIGFGAEGCLRGRIRSVDGGLEADIPMAWLREPS